MAYVTDPKNHKQSGNFKALDAKLTTRLGRVLYRKLGQHKNFLEEETAQRQETLGGDKTAGHAFPCSKSEGVFLEQKRLSKVEKRDDSIRASLTDWELVLCSLNERPYDHDNLQKVSLSQQHLDSGRSENSAAKEQSHEALNGVIVEE